MIEAQVRGLTGVDFAFRLMDQHQKLSEIIIHILKK